jgi:hypothetical protein
LIRENRTWCGDSDVPLSSPSAACIAQQPASQHKPHERICTESPHQTQEQGAKLSDGGSGDLEDAPQGLHAPGGTTEQQPMQASSRLLTSPLQQQQQQHVSGDEDDGKVVKDRVVTQDPHGNVRGKHKQRSHKPPTQLQRLAGKVAAEKAQRQRDREQVRNPCVLQISHIVTSHSGLEVS